MQISRTLSNFRISLHCMIPDEYSNWSIDTSITERTVLGTNENSNVFFSCTFSDVDDANFYIHDCTCPEDFINNNDDLAFEANVIIRGMTGLDQYFSDQLKLVTVTNEDC